MGVSVLLTLHVMNFATLLIVVLEDLSFLKLIFFKFNVAMATKQNRQWS